MTHDDFCPCASCSSQSRVLREMARVAEEERKRRLAAEYQSFISQAALEESSKLRMERAKFREVMA